MQSKNVEELSLVPADSDAGNNAKPAGELIQFAPFLEVLAENETKALSMAISADMPPEERRALAKDANTLRLLLKKSRCAADKAKDKLLEEVKTFSKKVHAANGDIWDRCQKAEKHLEDIEKFEETERRRVEQENRAARAAALAPFLTGPTSVDLGLITEAEFQSMLADAKDLHSVREERLRKEKAEAAAIAKAEEDERQRIAAETEAERRRIEEENARLKEEAADREKAATAERERIDAERKKERDAAAERERVIQETARKEREAAEAQAKKAEVERKRLADADTARLKKEAEEKKEKDLAAKKAAAAPDKEKITAYLSAMPVMPTLQNASAMRRIHQARAIFDQECRAAIAEMES